MEQEVTEGNVRQRERIVSSCMEGLDAAIRVSEWDAIRGRKGEANVRQISDYERGDC